MTQWIRFAPGESLGQTAIVTKMLHRGFTVATIGFQGQDENDGITAWMPLPKDAVKDPRGWQISHTDDGCNSMED
jgi:hypothetical protein